MRSNDTAWNRLLESLKALRNDGAVIIGYVCNDSEVAVTFDEKSVPRIKTLERDVADLQEKVRLLSLKAQAKE